MARVCELTGKSTQHGGSRKHRKGSSGAGGHWKFKAQRTSRVWKPNLRKVRLIDPEGNEVTMKISMKAYKKLRQGKSIKGYKLVPNKYPQKPKKETSDES
jgi:ribosomal protein L28